MINYNYFVDLLMLSGFRHHPYYYPKFNRVFPVVFPDLVIFSACRRH